MPETGVINLAKCNPDCFRPSGGAVRIGRVSTCPPPVNWRSALRQFPLRHPRPASQNRTRRRVKGAARCAIGAHRRKRLDHKSLRGLVLRRLRFARRSIACGPPQFARLTALPQRYEKYGCHSVSSVFACRSTQLLPLRQKWRGLTKNRYQAGIRLIANNCCQRLY
jgi:hypothetical protein